MQSTVARLEGRKMDLNKLSRDELRALRDDLAQRTREADQEAKRMLLNKFSHMAEEAGFTLEEVVGLLDSRRGPVKAKYRHPSDPEITWSGRGRTPTWLKELEDNGRDRERFRVDRKTT